MEGQTSVCTQVTTGAFHSRTIENRIASGEKDEGYALAFHSSSGTDSGQIQIKIVSQIGLAKYGKRMVCGFGSVHSTRKKSRSIPVGMTVLGRRDVFSKAHDVVAAIDVNYFAGDAAAGVGGEEDSGRTNFAYFHVAAQRSALGVAFVHVSEASDAARGQGLNRAGGNGVDSNLLLSQFVGQVANRTFQCRLWPQPSRYSEARLFLKRSRSWS